jgi:hypothetical protein
MIMRLLDSRFYSHFLALLLKADPTGVLPPGAARG